MRLAARKKDKAQWIDFLKKNKKKTNGKWVQNYYSEVLNPPPLLFSGGVLETCSVYLH